MPIIKYVSGHSKSLAAAAYYLTKNERALAIDCINLPERGIDGTPWNLTMDRTRRDLGTNSDYHGKKARTYEHIMISLDERDSKVALEAFRQCVTEWAAAFFDGDLGHYQVAIVYHDDNATRIAAGKQGILHAHLIVNNVELETSGRIAQRLTPKALDAMSAHLNRAALAQGWHAFSREGRSMTEQEMREAGTEASEERRAEPIADRGEAHAVETDAPASRNDRRDDLSHTGTDARRASSIQRILFGDGSVYEVHVSAPIRETIAERRVYLRSGRTWKQDMRDRVDIAIRLSRSATEFAAMLRLTGMECVESGAGGIKYALEDAEGAHEATGEALGGRYTAAAVREAISSRYAEKRRRGSATRHGERYIEAAERNAVMASASRIEPGTRAGHRAMARIKALLSYNDHMRIKGYEEYPDTEDGRAARSLAEAVGAFASPGEGPVQRQPLSTAERLELIRESREKHGQGGLSGGSESVSATPSKHSGAPSESAIARDERAEK